jgi:dienelactone hydrolase
LSGCFAAAFAFPQSLPEPSIRDAPPPHTFESWSEIGRADGTVEYLVEYDSPVVSPVPVNNRVPLRVFLPEEQPGPIPVVLVLHYWGAMDLRAERSMAAELGRRGIAAAVLTLPYHLARTPAGVRSGDLAIEPDPGKMRLTMRQAVSDVRRALDFLASRPEISMSRVGIAGTSLGAVVAATAYAVDARITHGAFVVGGIDLAGIIWKSSRLTLIRDALRRKGITEDDLRAELSSVEPANLLPRSSPGPSLVVAARYDTVIPRDSTQTLVDRLFYPRVLRIATGHYGGIFVQRRLLREVATFFASEFEGETYVPPDRILAPTLRIGLKADLGLGFDLFAGIDLVRFDSRGTSFSSLVLTPRGPQVFVGVQVSEGLSLGVSAATRGLGLGLFWSSVL